MFTGFRQQPRFQQAPCQVTYGSLAPNCVSRVSAKVVVGELCCGLVVCQLFLGVVMVIWARVDFSSWTSGVPVMVHCVSDIR